MDELHTDDKSIRILPVLPLKNTVLYPNLMLPLSVGSEASRSAVEAARLPKDVLVEIETIAALG